jgi:hypothetical protein
MVRSSAGIGKRIAVLARAKNYRPILSSGKAPHVNKPQLADSNQNLIMEPRWLLNRLAD